MHALAGLADAAWRAPEALLADDLSPNPSAAQPERMSAAQLFSQLFPSGVRMTAELLADLEQWAHLTGRLATHSGGPQAQNTKR